jgi:ATP-dependent Clp protease ATP-binding subunit ClpA
MNDIATISRLCSAAEKHAGGAGQRQPGAEHFLLAALDLPDGSARRVFQRAGADASQFSSAIERQYQEALQAVGAELPMFETEEPVAPASGLYKAQPSGQEVMQRLAEQRTPGIGLSGAHVVLAVASSAHGVAPRALRAMGVDRETLVIAARAEIDAAAR